MGDRPGRCSEVSFLLVPFVFASDIVHLSLSLSIYASWGLCWKEEVGCETGNCAQYCAAGDPCAAAGEDASCPCASGKTYHGRGPMQLSWNYNYEPAGRALGVDLLAEPERITQDPDLAFSTAMYFWMSPRGNKVSLLLLAVVLASDLALLLASPRPTR